MAVTSDLFLFDFFARTPATPTTIPICRSATPLLQRISTFAASNILVVSVI
jgi:hypothetical protein